MNRRHFLGLALSATAMPVFAERQSHRLRILSFHHRHTGEKVKVTYRVGNAYQRDALQMLNDFMRDFRTDDVVALDPKLFDLLYDLNRRLGHPQDPIGAYHASLGTSADRVQLFCRCVDSGLRGEGEDTQATVIDRARLRVKWNHWSDTEFL